MLASILAMAGAIPQLVVRRALTLQDERVKAMLVLDASWDNSDAIVAEWLVELRAAFATRGQPLSQR